MTERQKSRYRQKRERGNQLYGPGCCAHSVQHAQIEYRKNAAREHNHKWWVPGTSAEGKILVPRWIGDRYEQSR